MWKVYFAPCCSFVLLQDISKLQIYVLLWRLIALSVIPGKLFKSAMKVLVLTIELAMSGLWVKVLNSVSLNSSYSTR